MYWQFSFIVEYSSFLFGVSIEPIIIGSNELRQIDLDIYQHYTVLNVCLLWFDVQGTLIFRNLANRCANADYKLVFDAFEV